MFFTVLSRNNVTSGNGPRTVREWSENIVQATGNLLWHHLFQKTDCAIRRMVGHRVIVSCFGQRNMKRVIPPPLSHFAAFRLLEPCLSLFSINFAKFKRKTKIDVLLCLIYIFKSPFQNKNRTTSAASRHFTINRIK